MSRPRRVPGPKGNDSNLLPPVPGGMRFEASWPVDHIDPSIAQDLSWLTIADS